MLANVGAIDRAMRLCAGAALIALALFEREFDWGWLGLWPLLTGLARHCPVYGLLGLSTCRR